MILNSQITGYIIPSDASLQDALTKINQNRHRTIYVVDEKNFLLGSVSDGDIRRWLLSTSEINLSVSILALANQPCFSMSIESKHDLIENFFNERILSIPLVDDYGHLKAIAESRPNFIDIGSKRISKEDPAFIIAEIGNNHQGDIRLAKKLVDLAISAGVDCVKFQMRDLKSLYKNQGLSTDASADLGAQYTLDLLSKFQLSDEELYEVFDYCKNKNMIPLCTPWDLESLEKLEEYGMEAYKVASADFTNHELIKAITDKGKPVICSTGMSSEDEILSTVSLLKKRHAQVVLMHCNSSYPSPFKDVKLNYLKRLENSSNFLVGYSGHERGISVPIAAVAIGAKVIEKHITFDRNLEGNDHKVSLLPDEFKMMVDHIRQVEEALGKEEPREITQGELMNREVLAKSLIINCDLNVGEIISSEMIEIKSPGQGIQPHRINELIGRASVRKLKKGDFFFESDINGKFFKKNRYSFNRPFGIPVRYHDFKQLTKDVDLDFVEFHFSYRDLELDPNKYLGTNNEIGFAVHAPELFSGDHILDLCSNDQKYRDQSISEIKKVVQITKKLRKYFPKTDRPRIVINAGGWNTDGFFSNEIKIQKYNLIRDALNQINDPNIEFAIQTMPPFPWHFGGQSYHNLFVDPNEIKKFCSETGYKVCLDVSHSMMACNYYGWDLDQFIQIVSPYIVHMHIVDAKGSDGEGIQLGKGDVDFNALGKLLDEVAPNVPFIPEIWQGHKNSGQGFWDALGFLEKKFPG